MLKHKLHYPYRGHSVHRRISQEIKKVSAALTWETNLILIYLKVQSFNRYSISDFDIISQSQRLFEE